MAAARSSSLRVSPGETRCPTPISAVQLLGSSFARTPSLGWGFSPRAQTTSSRNALAPGACGWERRTGLELGQCPCQRARASRNRIKCRLPPAFSDIPSVHDASCTVNLRLGDQGATGLAGPFGAGALQKEPSASEHTEYLNLVTASVRFGQNCRQQSSRGCSSLFDSDRASIEDQSHLRVLHPSHDSDRTGRLPCRRRHDPRLPRP